MVDVPDLFGVCVDADAPCPESPHHSSQASPSRVCKVRPRYSVRDLVATDLMRELLRRPSRSRVRHSEDTKTTIFHPILALRQVIQGTHPAGSNERRFVGGLKMLAAQTQRFRSTCHRGDDQREDRYLGTATACPVTRSPGPVPELLINPRNIGQKNGVKCTVFTELRVSCPKTRCLVKAMPVVVG